MIEISRRLARQFRAVLRRSLGDRRPRGSAPLVLCRADRHGLTLHAGDGDVSVRHRMKGVWPPAAVAFGAGVLAEFEGRSEASVTLEQLGPGKGRARWDDGGLPRVLDFPAVEPDAVPPFPDTPGEWQPLPEEFLPALDEATRTTAKESYRLALSRVQLRGTAGEVVATDGRQLLVQADFALPWADDVLVPRLAVFGQHGLLPDGPVALTRTASHVVLRVGAWDFALAIDHDGRFPDVQGVIPRPSAVTSRLRLDPADAAFLAEALPRLPGREGENGPVTLELGQSVAVRARPADGEGPVTEVVLSRSAVTGPPVRLHLDRRFLRRALLLGFTEVLVARADTPLVCRDCGRCYAWAPLDAQSAIPPGPDALRIASTQEPISNPTEPPTQRRTPPMTTPSNNGRPPEPQRPPDQPGRDGGIGELIAEAEALRTVLYEAHTRAGRLLAALKQQRRQARAVQQAMQSLRQLRLDR